MEKSAEYTLLFQYVVGPGQRTSRLDYVDEWALHTNGAAIVEADDIAEGTGNYPYNLPRRRRDDDDSAEPPPSSSSSPPRPQPNPNGPHDRSPLPREALGARLANLRLPRPGDEMTGAPGAPTSLSSRGGGLGLHVPHFVVGNAYVLRVTSDAPAFGPTHSSHSHTPQEVGQMDQTSMRWRSMKTLNVGEDFFPSVLHVQVGGPLPPSPLPLQERPPSST